MSPAEFVARDALVFWVGTLAVLAPVALAAWLWRRRIVAACDRFWDRFDPPEPDPFASARQFAESQVGRPYQYGVASVPDDWSSDGRLDPVKVNETLEEWERAFNEKEDGSRG